MTAFFNVEKMRRGKLADALRFLDSGTERFFGPSLVVGKCDPIAELGGQNLHGGNVAQVANGCK